MWLAAENAIHPDQPIPIIGLYSRCDEGSSHDQEIVLRAIQFDPELAAGRRHADSFKVMLIVGLGP